MCQSTTIIQSPAGFYLHLFGNEIKIIFKIAGELLRTTKSQRTSFKMHLLIVKPRAICSFNCKKIHRLI